MNPQLTTLQNELAILRVEEGNEHPETVEAMMTLGAYLIDQSMFAEAEPVFREALETRRQTLGDLHTDTIESIYNRARVLYLLDRLPESEALYREYLEALLRTQPHSTLKIQLALTTLSRVFRNQDKQTDSNELLRWSRRIGRIENGLNL